MIIRFWGSRGGIPSPSKETVEFGANTSCVEVTLDGGETIVLDAGSGIRPMGLDYLSRNGVPHAIHILVSHVHWDHIQGFPFFVPAYIGKYTLHLHSTYDLKETLGKQMSPPFFPVDMGAMKSERVYHRLDYGDSFKIGNADVATTQLPHTQPVCGFRIEEGGRSVVYSTDCEPANEGEIDAIAKFARKADALLIDSQYTPEDYERGHVGWGHTTHETAIEIARRAEAGKLILFHHDPAHTDAEVLEIEKKAKEALPRTIAAREGLILEV